MSYAPDRLEPPPEHQHHRWHWIETEHGMMVASWHPIQDLRRGMWDISGHTKDADNPFVRRSWRYVGPCVPPEIDDE